MTMDSNTISLIFKLLFTFVLVCKTVTGEPSPITNDINAMIYLQRFGYMNESLGAANLIAIDTYQDAIKDFQRFSGINETGLLDEETILMMNTPRCGNKDHNGQAEHARRRKRYALQGSKWRRTDLTYRISKYPRKVKKSQIDTEIARAFQVWSEVTPLNFIPKKDGRVHIDIKFVVGEHGDGDPFDGPGNTLAHAYFPQYGGDAHFDDEEYWTIDSYTGTNLFQVAAHELGHSLGLGHSSTRESLMAPFYQRYKPNFRLSKDDILGIQSLYGPRTEPQTTAPPKEIPYSPPPPPKFPGSTPEPDISDAPDLCQDGRIDAVTRIADGTTYVFKGKHYWKVETNGLADGYPRRISDDWDGLPGDIDAALTWADGKTFIFKGNNYWRFHNRKMDSGYPKNISLGFAGIPNNIDTAFVWSGNGKTYFFKDKLYWRFDSKNDPPVSSRYPKPIKNWVGLPSNIDAAFKWENGLTYFFKGTNYYRFNDNDFEVDSSAKPPFPRQTSVWWFDCKSAANSPFRGSLISGQNRSKFIGALMSNTMDQDLESSAASSSSSSSQIQSDSGSIGTISGSSLSSSSGKNGNHHDSRISSGEEDKEWTIHGRFDHRDLAAAVYSHAIICKTNMILMALSLLLTITRKLTES